MLAKTNQFKFNSKTFSEKELIKLKKHSIVISFKDKIQNYGIIGVLILNEFKKNKALEIVNWVMSCRVFSRRIENYILDHIIKEAKKRKCNKISFKFEKTKKNLYLQEFFSKIKIKTEKNKNYYTNAIAKIKNNYRSYIKASKF